MATPRQAAAAAAAALRDSSVHDKATKRKAPSSSSDEQEMESGENWKDKKTPVDWGDVEAKAKKEALWLMEWRKQQQEAVRSGLWRDEAPKKRQRKKQQKQQQQEQQQEQQQQQQQSNEATEVGDDGGGLAPISHTRTPEHLPKDTPPLPVGERRIKATPATCELHLPPVRDTVKVELKTKADACSPTTLASANLGAVAAEVKNVAGQVGVDETGRVNVGSAKKGVGNAGAADYCADYNSHLPDSFRERRQSSCSSASAAISPGVSYPLSLSLPSPSHSYSGSESTAMSTCAPTSITCASVSTSVPSSPAHALHAADEGYQISAGAPGTGEAGAEASVEPCGGSGGDESTPSLWSCGQGISLLAAAAVGRALEESQREHDCQEKKRRNRDDDYAGGADDGSGSGDQAAAIVADMQKKENNDRRPPTKKRKTVWGKRGRKPAAAVAAQFAHISTSTNPNNVLANASDGGDARGATLSPASKDPRVHRWRPKHLHFTVQKPTPPPGPNVSEHANALPGFASSFVRPILPWSPGFLKPAAGHRGQTGSGGSGGGGSWDHGEGYGIGYWTKVGTGEGDGRWMSPGIGVSFRDYHDEKSILGDGGGGGGWVGAEAARLPNATALAEAEAVGADPAPREDDYNNDNLGATGAGARTVDWTSGPFSLRCLPSEALEALQEAGAAGGMDEGLLEAAAVAMGETPSEKPCDDFVVTKVKVKDGKGRRTKTQVQIKKKKKRKKRTLKPKRETHVLVSESEGEEPGGTSAAWRDVEEAAKEEAKALLLARNSGMTEVEKHDHQHWVRRSVRAAGSSQVDSPHVVKLLAQIRSNDPEVEVLKLHHYLGPDVNTAVIDAVLEAVEDNTNCQALYIQNFNEGFRDEQVCKLASVLRKGRIWCLNAGENYKVDIDTWWDFVQEIKSTNVTHAYLSEHVITPDLKNAMRDAIRENRSKHTRHKSASNLDVIRRCTNMWWNPINSKSLQAELREMDIDYDKLVNCAPSPVTSSQRLPCSLHGSSGGGGGSGGGWGKASPPPLDLSEYVPPARRDGQGGMTSVSSSSPPHLHPS